jgi:hypothetical protein
MTRPDVAFAQSILARFSSGGGEAHMEKLRDVIRYLVLTKHYTITYQKGHSEALMSLLEKHSDLRREAIDSEDILSFSDASHGGERPMAGQVHLESGGPVAWKAGRLAHTPMSACEGEYSSAVLAAINSMKLRGVLKFMKGTKVMLTSLLFCDNIAAVMLSDSNTSSKRMKHVATRIAFLRELRERKEVTLYHVGTKSQVADIFTKPLGPSVFHELRPLLIN